MVQDACYILFSFLFISDTFYKDGSYDIMGVSILHIYSMHILCLTTKTCMLAGQKYWLERVRSWHPGKQVGCLYKQMMMITCSIVLLKVGKLFCMNITSSYLSCRPITSSVNFFF